jgi:hypothetical protein
MEGTNVFRGLNEGPPGLFMTTGEAEIFLNFTMWYIMRESLGDDFFFRLEAELLLLLLPPESGERVFFKEEERGEGLGEEGVAGISMELMRTRRVRGDSDMGERVIYKERG